LKILFDEGVPRQLRRSMAERQITLVEEAGWKGIKNGRLLQLAEENNFDVLVTADQQLKHQQNLKGRKIAIIVLPYNRRKWMPLLVPKLVAALDKIQPGNYVELPMPENLS
jgi:predicted nuclease of predicted toxin-antitoxin system